MSASFLICGAGPVGLVMALELASFGISVRIVDKNNARTDKSKALAVWSRTLEQLERSGSASALVDAGRKTRAARIMSAGDTIARIAFDELDSPFPFVLMVPQSETERVLEERLASLGVRVERNVELVDFIDTGPTVSCRLLTADGAEEEAVVNWLIGCDGAHSTVRHKLGFEFDGETVPGKFVLADVHVDGLQIPEDEFPIFWHRRGIVAFFPIGPRRFRVIADLGAEGADGPTLELVQSIVDQRGPGGLTLSDAVWIAPFTINERKVKDFRAGRVFLAGDSAHVHSPAGGQGMNTGIQDAVNLAWKLALACEGKVDAELLLESYSVERSANAAQVLKDSGRMLRVGTMPNAAAQIVRNFLIHSLFGLSAVKHLAAEQLSELSVHYAESPLNGVAAARLSFPHPGHRLLVEARFQAALAPRFTLIASDEVEARARLRDHMHLIGDDIRDPQGMSGICVVRPDGYVAMTAANGGWADVSAYFDRISGRAFS